MTEDNGIDTNTRKLISGDYTITVNSAATFSTATNGTTITGSNSSTTISTSEKKVVSFSIVGIPEQLEYARNYSIAASPTPSKLIVKLFGKDKNANWIERASDQTDGQVAVISIPFYKARLAKRFPPGDYEIRVTTVDVDGNSQEQVFTVTLVSPA